MKTIFFMPGVMTLDDVRFTGLQWAATELGTVLVFETQVDSYAVAWQHPIYGFYSSPVIRLYSCGIVVVELDFRPKHSPEEQWSTFLEHIHRTH